MVVKQNLIIFGASGFTGKFVVEELVKLIKAKKVEDVSWAIAGRSKEKLENVLKDVTEFTGYDVTGIPIIVANISDQSSLHSMCRAGNVILNCVGPYRFYGEQVVTACLAEGAHYVDICGESQFLEKMQLLYHDEAEEKGVYIVGACGFDSLPADLGVTFLRSRFEGDLNSVEMYMSFGPTEKSVKIHYATWQSVILLFANKNELPLLREKLFPEALPKPKYKLKQKSMLHYSNYVNGWCLPFPGTDKSIVMRSERYFFTKDKTRPIQMRAYHRQNNWFFAMVLLFGLMFFKVIVRFKIGKFILEKFPGFFSFGTVSHEGPTRDEADIPFTFTLVGEGWKEKLTLEDRHTDPPNKKMVVQVSGQNPGYGATCIAMIMCGLTILKESDKIPSNGGVYTTAVAFSKTNLIEQLSKNGIVFKVVEEEGDEYNTKIDMINSS